MRDLWQGIIPESDLAAYRAAGWGNPSGIGRRLALLVIDVQYRTTGTAARPILEAVNEYPTACGEAAWKAVPHIASLIAAFRGQGYPVIFPHVAQKRPHDGGRLASKIPAAMGISQDGYQFVREVAPRQHELTIPKKHPSAFFGTPLASHLVDLGVDTLVLTGCTTSGCIRATAVDGFSYNYKCVVPCDAVYDRGVVPHAVNLFDLSQKYADVMTTADLLGKLDEMAQDAQPDKA
ncbi:Maleamate amidohydrolase [Pigmentiphaga humi]|uniref:Maleamate amidohydrolase n=1 Tax=Pigmentiphaga humi TaxID=2478468 RepID=A0A3P4B0W2_9BURK|nr:isochorismatase family protein [Pigmentiphaga humi]VCU68765.1 Maleamate amidohydrolase [Pigmentiphaga humi]